MATNQPSSGYDGDWTRPFQVGPAITSVDEITRGTITEVTFWARVALYKIQPRGSTGINRKWGFLCEQPSPRYIGGDVVEYVLRYATLPPDRVEPEASVYNFQFLVDGSLVELPVPVTLQVGFHYIHQKDPAQITLRKAFKAVQLGDVIHYVGELPNERRKTPILAQDESLNRVIGDIWEVKTQMVDYWRALQTVDGGS